MKKVIEPLFLSGDYQQIVEMLKRGAHPLGIEQIFAIGALVFTGRIHEAQALADGEVLDIESRCARLFFLAVFHIRSSQYKKGQDLIAEALSMVRNQKSGTARFFAYQGAAFSKFFYGKLADCITHAEEAYTSALKSRFVYGQILALDLIGHSSIGIGMVRRGLKTLDEALMLSQEIGHKANIGALQVSILKYKIQMGIEPAINIPAMEKLFATVSEEDTYSKAEILLELIRQRLLKGEFDHAERLIAIGFETIYRHGNLRQVARLNHRLASLMWNKGQYVQGLSLLKTSRLHLDEQVDIPLKSEIIGLERKILEHEESFSDQMKQSVHEDLARLAATNEHMIHKRIEARAAGKIVSKGHGEDPLGDLLDQQSSDPDGSKAKIAESGYYGLFAKSLNFFPAKEGIVVDFIPGSALLVSRSGIVLKRLGTQRKTRMILELLSSQGMVSKEILIKTIWGYKYHPLKHDSLIYAAMARVRSLLVPNEKWLETLESGYRLHKDVEVEFAATLFEAGASIERQKEPVNVDPLRVQLNYRQYQFLSSLANDQVVQVSDFAAQFDVSIMTAFRDLKELVEKKLIRHSGEGRGRRYFR